jgi:hypothetical protein
VVDEMEPRGPALAAVVTQHLLRLRFVLVRQLLRRQDGLQHVEVDGLRPVSPSTPQWEEGAQRWLTLRPPSRFTSHRTCPLHSNAAHSLLLDPVR